MSNFKKSIVLVSIVLFTCLASGANRKRTIDQEGDEQVDRAFKKHRHHEAELRMRPAFEEREQGRIYQAGEVLVVRMRRFEVCETGPAQLGYVKVYALPHRAGHRRQEGWLNPETQHYSLAESPEEAVRQYNNLRNNFQTVGFVMDRR